MKKKVFIVALVVIALLGAMWWIFSGTPQGGTAEEGGGIRRFNPFGIFGDGGDVGPAPATTTPGISTSEFIPRFRQITAGPVAGAGFAYGTTSDVFIRFIERETGHVFETSTSTTVLRRITNTTIPRVAEALWNPQGSIVAVRYLRSDGETIETFIASVPEQKNDGDVVGEHPLSGSITAPNILSLAWAPDGTEFFAVTPAEDGSFGTIFDTSGAIKRRVFTSPLREWLAAWPTRNAITLTAKPSAGVRGFTYSISRTGGEFSKIIDGFFGLSALPNTGLTKMAYAHISGGRLTLKMIDVKSGETQTLPLATLAEKCAWGSGDMLFCAVPTVRLTGLPDTWYQGVVATRDALWQIDTKTGTADVLTDTAAYAEGGIDVASLSVDLGSTHLLLTDKTRGSLWILRITP